MSRIDLKEIPIAVGGSQDTFELFARDFLEALGFKILQGPDRGPDDGRDILACEPLVGVLADSERRWLVSVKHYAHSGRAVSMGDEPDIVTRAESFGASGVMSFYSTLPSSPLARRLDKLKSRGLNIFIYDAGRISQSLQSDSRLRNVFRQYLPVSYLSIYRERSEKPLKLVTDTGMSSAGYSQVTLDLTAFVSEWKDDSLRISDPELEDIVTACILAEALSKSRFCVVKTFVSFRSRVWTYLAELVKGRIDGPALAAEIDLTEDSFYLRLLIALAGAAQVDEAAEPICRRVLLEGRHHHFRTTLLDANLTPFLEVAKDALSRLSASTMPILAIYQEKAASSKRWREKALFERVIRNGEQEKRRSRGNHV